MTSFVVFLVQLADRTYILQQRSFLVIINYVILTEPRVQRVVLVYNYGNGSKPFPPFISDIQRARRFRD